MLHNSNIIAIPYVKRLRIEYKVWSMTGIWL